MDAELQKLVNRVNKKHGEGTILVGSEIRNTFIPRITTGILSLDVALGGGWAANQWNEVVGNESHGKTALALKTVATNQALDPTWTCLWFASEPINLQYAEMLGVDLERLVVVEDNTMEVVYQTAIDAAAERACDCIVIDSLPALVSVREEEGTMDDLQPGQSAFLTGKFFRKSSPAIKRSLMVEDRQCTGLVINQWREKIGVMHGDPRTTPGGKGKNFFFYIRVDVSRTEWITNTKNAKIGQAIRVRNIKNKTAPPGVTSEFDFYFARGNGQEPGDIDVLKDVINVGIEFNVIVRAGAYYRFGGQQWQGREALVEALRDDADLQALVRKEVMASFNTDDYTAEVDEPEAVVEAPKRTRKVTKK